jgi:Mce-associated membrane protein
MAVDVDASRTVTDAEAESAPETTDERPDGDSSDAQASVVGSRRRWKRRPSTTWVATSFVLVVIFALAGLAGWFGFQTAQARQVDAQQELFLQAGRQAAVNLTTIDYATVDADVQRVIDSSMDPFAGEFTQNSSSFAEVVRSAKSKSVGRVTEAGIESVDGDKAQVLVTVSVNTDTAGVPDEQPRLWRMRVTVQQEGDAVKVSNVGFVP